MPIVFVCNKIKKIGKKTSSDWTSELKKPHTRGHSENLSEHFLVKLTNGVNCLKLTPNHTNIYPASLDALKKFVHLTLQMLIGQIARD